MDRPRFERYVDAFNRRDYLAAGEFFAPDFVMEFYTSLSNPLEPPRTRRGLAGFIENYKALHAISDEAIELGKFMSDGSTIVAELYSEFQFFQDAHPAFSPRPLKAGDFHIATNWIIYDLVDDKFARVRISHFRIHDPSRPRLLTPGERQRFPTG